MEKYINSDNRVKRIIASVHPDDKYIILSVTGYKINNEKDIFRVMCIDPSKNDTIETLFFNRLTKGIVWRAVTCRRMFFLFYTDATRSSNFFARCG